jgi:hypothetical protein
VFEEGGDGRGGRRPRAREGRGLHKGEGRGAAEKSKGTRGRVARVRGETSGPDQDPRPNSFTRQLPTPAHESDQNSTVLLVNASQKFQIPKSAPP